MSNVRSAVQDLIDWANRQPYDASKELIETAILLLAEVLDEREAARRPKEVEFSTEPFTEKQISDGYIGPTRMS